MNVRRRRGGLLDTIIEIEKEEFMHINVHSRSMRVTMHRT